MGHNTATPIPAVIGEINSQAEGWSWQSYAKCLQKYFIVAGVVAEAKQWTILHLQKCILQANPSSDWPDTVLPYPV